MNVASKTVLFGLLFALFSTTAAAMPRTGRIVTGTLRQVDHARKSAVIVPDDGSQPLAFTWVSRTVVFIGSREVSPSALRDGMLAKIIRHVPFFGPPFATRVNVPGTPAPDSSKAARSLSGDPKVAR